MYSPNSIMFEFPKQKLLFINPYGPMVVAAILDFIST